MHHGEHNGDVIIGSTTTLNAKPTSTNHFQVFILGG